MKRVLITGGDGDIAQAIKHCLESKGSYEVFTPGKQELDVTNTELAQAYIKVCKPDILVNNAGFVLPQRISACNLNIIKQSLDINLFGVFNCTATALAQNPNTKIINIGSSAATKLHGTWSDYCAAKAAVVMATQCWAEDGFFCVCVSPGRTATKMRRKLYPDEDQRTLMRPDDFAQVVAMAIEGAFENGAHINVNAQNVHTFLRGEQTL